MSNQLSQLPVEVLVLVPTSTVILRVSQEPVEVAILSNVPVPARLSQLPIEVMIAPTLNYGQISQLPVEVLMQSNVPISGQISQLPIEVLIKEILFNEQTQFFIIMS